MENKNLIYKILNPEIVIKIPKFLKILVPKFLRKKIKKKLFKYIFLPTSLNTLPELNYPIQNNYHQQKELIKIFELNNKQNSFMTCPHLIQLLLMSFKQDEEFSFLDFGGEKIDFYLELKKKFKNVKYYVFNQKEILKTFDDLKNEYSFKDLNIIFEISEIYKNKYEFINFGGSIQYINNYNEILDNITNVSKKYIFFSATTFYNSKDKNFNKNIVVKQINLLPTMFYMYFFNREYFLQYFLKKNYCLFFEKKNLTHNINYDNFNNLIKSSQYTDIMFLRKY
tara:strand:- start:1404 stop:2249 length:846 start_codon:yes stop_codon:yes gene_type:complete